MNEIIEIDSGKIRKHIIEIDARGIKPDANGMINVNFPEGLAVNEETEIRVLYDGYCRTNVNGTTIDPMPHL